MLTLYPIHVSSWSQVEWYFNIHLLKGNLSEQVQCICSRLSVVHSSVHVEGVQREMNKLKGLCNGIILSAPVKYLLQRSLGNIHRIYQQSTDDFNLKLRYDLEILLSNSYFLLYWRWMVCHLFCVVHLLILMSHGIIMITTHHVVLTLD